MTFKTLLLPALLTLLAFGGCAGKPADPVPEKAVYTQISQEEAARIMAEEEDFILLDVRTEEEFAAGHIPGAICLPVDDIGTEKPEILPDTAQTVLVYCRSGRRSKIAAQTLAALGYTDVREFGGILDWTGDVVTQ